MSTRTFKKKKERLKKDLYLFPSHQEEVYGGQVDAEFLAEAHQQVPDGHAAPQGYRATRAIR